METGNLEIWSRGIEIRLIILKNNINVAIFLLCSSKGQFKLFIIDVTLEVLEKSLYTNLLIVIGLF